MKFLVVALSLFATSASAQGYTVTATGKIIDRANCYAFQIPAGWQAAAQNPAPLLLHIAPGTRPRSFQTLPPGAATLSLVSGASGEKPKTIEAWIALRRRAYSFSSVRELHYPASTGITRAVEVRWTDAKDLEPGQPVSRTVAVFFAFRGNLFASYLDYYVKDKSGGHYLTALTQVLGSFRPLAASPACPAKPR